MCLATTAEILSNDEHSYKQLKIRMLLKVMTSQSTFDDTVVTKIHANKNH
jgi:hypothetical protein